jgi:DNA-binding CsgD family transcriptional regulator
VVGGLALGHSQKVVAYELGIAPSTMRVLLARAKAKLGASSVEDLIERFRQHVG